MFAISLSDPQRELRLREVAVGRRDQAAVQRVAVHEQRGLRARHGQRHAVPRAVRQPEREGLHARRGGTGGHVVQSHLVAPPARLQLQVPAGRTASLLSIGSQDPSPRSRNLPLSELFRGTQKQSKQHKHSDGGRDGTGRERTPARSTSQYRSIGMGAMYLGTNRVRVDRATRCRWKAAGRTRFAMSDRRWKFRREIRRRPACDRSILPIEAMTSNPNRQRRTERRLLIPMSLGMQVRSPAVGAGGRGPAAANDNYQ